MYRSTSFLKILLVQCVMLAAGLSASAETAPSPAEVAGGGNDWPQVGGSIAGGHYIASGQITRENISGLEVAWIHRSGDYREGDNFIDGLSGERPLQTGFQVTPILFQGTMFYCTTYNRVFAVNPETGAEVWQYDPQVNQADYGVPRCRGVSSWTHPSLAEEAVCKHRILAPTMDARIIALDAATGQKCANFGDNGEISLRPGLGQHEPLEYTLTTPPLITKKLLITGSAVTDNLSTNVPSGVVRAFDLDSGKQVWAWDTIAPGATPKLNPATGEEYQSATTNVWSFISADEELGLAYVPTGNTSPDYYGGHRDGSDYYSSSVVALSIATGEVVWHFQTVHHDIWDYDVPSQPTLYEVEKDGEMIPALAQTTKMGYVFLLNRKTGEPLFPVEERPVPQGAAPGDFTAPTQPFPTKPPTLLETDFDADDVWGLTPFDRAACRKRLASLRNDGIFTPPTLGGTFSFPSAFGGQNWGGPALDPKRKKLIVNTLHVASILQLIPRDQCAQAEQDRQKDKQEKRFSFIEASEGTPYCDKRWLGFFSPLAIPCTPPPWGTLASIDLVSGDIDWQVPLGTTRDIAPFPFWFIKGVPNSGGPIVTESGLAFIAATTDYYLRAFDVETGEQIWKDRLPTAGHATPMSYVSPVDGKQYVVIAAGGSPSMGTPPGDYVIAYRLKD